MGLQVLINSPLPPEFYRSGELFEPRRRVAIARSREPAIISEFTPSGFPPGFFTTNTEYPVNKSTRTK